MTEPLDKTALRLRMRAARRRLAAAAPDAAQQAARRLPLSGFGDFRVIAAYRAQGAEIDPTPVLEALLGAAGGAARGALPVAADRDAPLQFRAWRPGEALAPDAFGIPAPTALAPPVSPDLVIAPLLAFDRHGGRLGQGAGHYDRTLAEVRRAGPVFVLGLAYAGQAVERLATEPHDQPLDAVLTELEYLEFAGR